ncbi:hypothetical protein [Entomomonas asaccharolytica]|uniref:Uncharacterized protein n=1 Tax=Entomomonas asaccharolytica TaxID=2785331 RepID=A0A974NDS0_9GAMM|nr:hypothetical protein [Entomomonas asaccharolytica]QQP84653.1 hypothetical protein JHT90_09550 [Entomomonas asaccharolytica]
MTIKHLLMVSIIATTATVTMAETQTELLPEVKEILQLKFDEQNIQQNAYISLLAIDAPEGLDYKEIGKKVVLASNKQIREAIAKQDHNLLEKGFNPQDYFQDKPALTADMTVDGKAYKFPCNQLNNHHCTTQLLNKQSALEPLLTTNKVLLSRYNEVIKLPVYHSPPLTAASYIPPFSVTLNLSRLRLSQALFMINRGEVDAGLDILQQEVTFAKRILAGQSALIDQMIANRQLLITYHVISELLDSPQLANQLNNPKLLALLQPLSTQEQQCLANTFANERNLTLFHLAASSSAYLANELVEQGLDKETGVANLALNYDRNATLNMYYSKVKPNIEMAMLTLPKASENYLTYLKDQPEYIALTGKEIYQKYGTDNFVGRALVEIATPNFKNYIERFYNLNTYLTLVNAKLSIKQAGIGKQQVPDFLVKLAAKAQNPYSKQPFTWNAETQILSSNWLGDSMGSDDGEQASVYIQFNK